MTRVRGHTLSNSIGVACVLCASCIPRRSPPLMAAAAAEFSPAPLPSPTTAAAAAARLAEERPFKGGATPNPVNIRFACEGNSLSSVQRDWWQQVVHIVLCLFGNKCFRQQALHPLYHLLFRQSACPSPEEEDLDSAIVAQLHARVLQVDIAKMSPAHLMEAFVPPESFAEEANPTQFTLHLNETWLKGIERVFAEDATERDKNSRPLHVAMGVLKLGGKWCTHSHHTWRAWNSQRERT